MRIATLVLVSLLLLVSPRGLVFAQVIPVCAGNPCTAAEVGVLMQDISGACGNVGTCSLGDIMQVFYNVGNWILGIVGAMVLLMYIWGGINILVGGASPERVGAGKKTIKTATLGLLIVFVAFAGITTLKQAFGGASGGGPSGEIACTQNTVGQACGDNKFCTQNECLEKCDIDYGDLPSIRSCLPRNVGQLCLNATGLCSNEPTFACCLSQL